jgi:hypothetical protein
MTCSPARMAANLVNAQKSTGPRTDEGKRKSRKNSLKHGLCSAVVEFEDTARFDARVKEFFYVLKPQDDYHAWLIDRIATFSLRVERAEVMERCLRDRRSLKAEVHWDDDLRLEAERLGGKLANRPAEVLEELRRSPVGCDWLISRWAMLARAAETNGSKWTPEQVTLAFDLLGTPAAFRRADGVVELLDGRGQVIDSADDLAAFARREIDRLEARREEVKDVDEVDRELTRFDLFDESNPELKKLRRYESTIFNRLQWALRELRYESPHFKPSPEMIERLVYCKRPQPAVEEPAPAPAPALAATATANAVETPMPKPKPKRYGDWSIESLHPPFGIEPHEVPKDGSRADLFGILLGRQEDREKQKESRRDGRRRKLEKLRA